MKHHIFVTSALTVVWCFRLNHCTTKPYWSTLSERTSISLYHPISIWLSDWHTHKGLSSKRLSNCILMQFEFFPSELVVCFKNVINTSALSLQRVNAWSWGSGLLPLKNQSICLEEPHSQVLTCILSSFNRTLKSNVYWQGSLLYILTGQWLLNSLTAPPRKRHLNFFLFAFLVCLCC